MKRITAGDAVVGVAAIAGLALLAQRHPDLVLGLVKGVDQVLQKARADAEVVRADALLLEGEAVALERENEKLRARIAELEELQRKEPQ